MINIFRSSKPTSSRTAPTDNYYSPHVAYDSFSSDYIPQIRVKPRSQPQQAYTRSRTQSYSTPPKKVSFPDDDYHRTHRRAHSYPSNDYKMQATGYSPQMAYAVPTAAPASAQYYYGSGGQVVYAPAGPVKVLANPNDSPLSQHREDLSRGRPRSHSVRDKVVLSPGSEAVKVPLGMVAHGPGSASHSSTDERPRRLFGSFMSSIRARSKSKSRERDSIIPSSSSYSAKSTISSHVDDSRDSRGRRYEREMRQDEAAEIARRMEKDLRLSDFEDPYRTLRRDRSQSQESTRSRSGNRDFERDRERMSRRFRDISPDVQDNTIYNARYLKYQGSPAMPTHQTHQSHQTHRAHPSHSHSSGYHTDVQPQMLRRSTTSAAATHVTKSRPIPASHASERSIHQPQGWFNRRGDELVQRGTIIRQPPEREYPSHLKHHPDVGVGFMDSKGNVIDANCRLIKRVG